MKFDDKDYKIIRENALFNFKDFAVNPKTEFLFVCRCYSEAVLTYLQSEGYVITKGEVKDVQE